jgi:polyhydroxyalkanoate synthase
MDFGSMPTLAGLRDELRRADRLRRRHGEFLDRLGFGPVRMASRVALRLPGARLRAYGGDAATPVLLMVPAPIKRAYIWDLAPSVSVIRRCLGHGFRVYLVEWTEPEPDTVLGLADYADRLLLACLDAVARETGQERVVLVGHSLGGTLAAIFASLHPKRVRAIVLLEAPTKFGRDAGPFAPLVAMMPGAAVRKAFCAVPGSFLDLVSITASPMSFVCARWLDHLTVLGDWRAATTQLRVERWALDEFPLPGRFFEEVVEALYREDRFLRGTLLVNGRAARPAALAMPLLSVVRPSSLIIPPQSVLPLHDVAPSRRQRLLRYDGDRGVSLQHVGVLVGEKAHRQIWPVILRWIEDGFRSRQPGSGSKETGGSSTRISRQRASASPPGTSRR